MPQIHDNNKSINLSPDDRARLERFAPWFDIDFRLAADGSYRIGGRVEEGGHVVRLSTEMAHLRLLTEVCSKAATWVHFHFGESCKDSLLKLSDARVQRLAELYGLSRDAGRRITAAECAASGRRRRRRN